MVILQRNKQYFLILRHKYAVLSMGWAVLWSDDVNAGCSVIQLFFSLNEYLFEEDYSPHTNL